MSEYGYESEPKQRTAKERVEKVAGNVFLLLVARYNMAVVTPLLLAAVLGMATFIWNGQVKSGELQAATQEKLITATNANTKELGDLKALVNSVINFQLPSTMQLFDSRFNAQATRIDEHARVNERQDKDIRDLQNRVYRGGNLP